MSYGILCVQLTRDLFAIAKFLVLSRRILSHYVVLQAGRLKMQDQKMEDQKIDERTENAGLKMKDQMSGVENAGPKHQDRKMEDQQPEADYEI